ncbi:MAG: hypothetical protein HZB95_05925 [Nitrosomonadales bacterium]|nr:hypothetical protein [Nitrosomonadales bacterium]
MNSLLSQVSYPVFLYMTFQFFLIASVFSFFVGIALALRSQKALRFFDLMNRWVSVRKMMKPLSEPHYIEPALLKRRAILGTTIMAGGLVSILLLANADLTPTLSLFEGSLTDSEITGVAGNLKGFLLVGNVVCMLVGALVLFSPHVLTSIEGYTDRWFTMRKTMQPLDKMHMDVDCWVLKHPTSAGISLSILSLSAGMLMLNQLHNITA